ncbi:MAG: hypothetical protein DI551_03760 [Micavibrio aeruginosavorus]|uniref:DUF748 domain-containing protein n=1 Tax=Micavibrio aeruginosavorus TaxID=349221 RepID=A0A2W5N8U8_9BACT|nr:MAG: hypothetical protein DI551_03760 [Micavibrio aeruginosavorus]
MKHARHDHANDDETSNVHTLPVKKAEPAAEKPAEPDLPHKERRKHIWRNAGIGAVIFLAIALIGARIYLPFWVTDYVNKTLNNIPGYTGSISGVGISLYRGAYTIHDLKLLKKDKGIPVPFIDIKKTDLSLQWGALFDGAVVGDVTLYQPTINFATSKSGATTQTGVETDWTDPIKELMPLDINFVEIHGGKVTYKNFNSSPNIDIFISGMEAKVTNLRNAEDKNVALPSNLVVTGKSIGGGNLRIDGNLNILKKIPDMAIKGKLEAVQLPALNDYSQAFLSIDFNKGKFDLYTDINVKNGQVSGFVKPLLREIDLIDWQNLDPNPLNVLWESVVSIVLEIFSNQSKDQVATQIQLEGSLDSPETNFWSTLNGILRNAFVKAYSNTVKEE